MPLSLLVALFTAFAGVCLISGIWLALHLTALAAMFHGKADIVASPRRPRASRGTVAGALAAFWISLAGVLAMQVVVLTA